MSGWRRRFGVGVGAVGVVAETSLRAGWLSVDWGVGGLCPRGLGVRSLWTLQNTHSQKKKKKTVQNNESKGPNTVAK